jgi:AraC family transcriptional regulator
MLQGGFQTRIARRSLACDATFAWTEPLAERHANHVGAEGAHALVFQPDPHIEGLESLNRLLNEVHLLRSASVVSEAHAIRMEFVNRDAFTDLVVEGRALVLLTSAARLSYRDGNGHLVPGWLTRVRDRLHDEWRSVPSLGDLAQTASVRPTHLAHAFRAHYGETVGSYLRKLRLNWAITQLATTPASISSIAASAGFSDQAHFTRMCKRIVGVTPAAYRSRVRNDPVQP